MTESKTTTQSKTTTAKKDEPTEANKRQEAAAKEEQKETAKASQSRAKAIDTGKFTVVLRDDADSTVHDVKILIAQMGGEVKSSSGRKITVEAPEGSQRNTGSLRQKLVEHLDGSPLVEEIE